GPHEGPPPDDGAPQDGSGSWPHCRGASACSGAGQRVTSPSGVPGPPAGGCVMPVLLARRRARAILSRLISSPPWHRSHRPRCHHGPMKGRVLVVDDDTALAEMLGIVLRGEGFD